MTRIVDQGQSFEAADSKNLTEHMVMPYSDGCLILRGTGQKLVVRHRKFPNRHWLADDLNTARMICDELNCE